MFSVMIEIGNSIHIKHLDIVTNLSFTSFSNPHTTTNAKTIPNKIHTADIIEQFSWKLWSTYAALANTTSVNIIDAIVDNIHMTII